jgi:hypothetical protein
MESFSSFTTDHSTLILVVVLTIFVAYILFARIIPLFRRMRGALRSYAKNKSANLTPEQYRKLVVGAIYSEQQSAYVNSLETGLEKSKVKKIVNEWWGIYDKQEALDKLDYLYQKGFAYYFPIVYNAFLSNNENEQKTIIINGLLPEEDKNRIPQQMDEMSEELKEDIGKAFSQLTNLKETFAELKEDKIIETNEDLLRYGVEGWDHGRLNFLARICYDIGYLTEEQAWFFIDRAYHDSKKAFTSWNDFAKSYVIGRALWGGSDSDNSGIAAIAESLLTDADSPWTELKW